MVNRVDRADHAPVNPYAKDSLSGHVKNSPSLTNTGQDQVNPAVIINRTPVETDMSLAPVKNAGRGPPGSGRHRAPAALLSLGGMRRLLGEHGARFASFSVIGGFVFVLGLGLQAFLVQVWGMGSIASYLVQGFVSVQASFLLNYYWTWRDKKVRFGLAWYRFNAQKIITTIFNLLIYAGLVAVHVNYLVANIATTAIFTAVNYVIGNSWTFVPSKGKNNCPPP